MSDLKSILMDGEIAMRNPRNAGIVGRHYPGEQLHLNRSVSVGIQRACTPRSEHMQVPVVFNTRIPLIQYR